MHRRLILGALALASLSAEVRLPALISDHMALQAGAPVRIWGWAQPGEQVTVAYRGQTLTATTGQRGRWQVFLAPMEAAAAGVEMSISGANRITVRDVVVGEIWIGSGQSNMEWDVNRAMNSEQEIAAANYPGIRLFEVAKRTSPTPLDDVEGKWEICSPASVKEFSAVGYFFSRHLHKKLNVPVGFIQTAWGGTPAQAWTSMGALNADPALQPILADWNKVIERYPEASANYRKAFGEWEKKYAGVKDAPPKPAQPAGPGHQHEPATLYNAMIHPVLPFTIKGATWYQGESNANKTQGRLYERLFTTMIRDWRDRWHIGDFPFLFVQLANFQKAASPEDWVLVQEAQAKTLNLRHTAMAVINDIGNPVDIHPTNKQDVGDRLALAARHLAYKEQVPFRGPEFRQATVEGSKIRVWFDSAHGLKAKGDSLKGFDVAGADRRWYTADAKVEGSTVVVSNPSVTEPVAVRYAWAANPESNLYNDAGLPASVFRSVNW
jgi:sialate O-acetylesterase